MTKSEIRGVLSGIESDCKKRCSSDKSELCDVTKFKRLVYENAKGEKIWSRAFKEALGHGGKLYIPDSTEPYYIDETIVLPQGSAIVAENAVIKRAFDFSLVMLRNQSNADGSYMPEKSDGYDENICVIGGIWDGGCGTFCTTPYAPDDSFHGVTANIFFNHARFVRFENVTVKNAGGFAIQVGDISNSVFENIKFIGCFADGLHIGGKSEKIVARNISGEVADDLVALNAFDWERSSVNFGKISTVLCENLELSTNSPYKAMRLLPGKYFYRDGSVSECDITNVVIKSVRGIKTFKMYFQRDIHKIHETPTYGCPGFADCIYFEDIEARLDAPIDALEPYMFHDKTTGQYSVFELGSEIGHIEFENVRAEIYKNERPTAYFLQVGAKSVRVGNIEIFDPQIGGTVHNLTLKNVFADGNALCEDNADEYVTQIVFDDIYGDGRSSSCGKIEKLNFI